MNISWENYKNSNDIGNESFTTDSIESFEDIACRIKSYANELFERLIIGFKNKYQSFANDSELNH